MNLYVPLFAWIQLNAVGKLSADFTELQYLQDVCVCPRVLQQDSCGEEERPSLVTVVKPSAKPRRARLLSKGRKLNNRKRGRPKKAAPVVEKKSKKNQSALDLLHAKTLSAAPPLGQTPHTHTHTQQNMQYITIRLITVDNCLF